MSYVFRNLTKSIPIKFLVTGGKRANLVFFAFVFEFTQGTWWFSSMA